MQLVDTVYRSMTNPGEDAATLLPGSVVPTTGTPNSPPRQTVPFQMLPHVGIGELTGFIERLYGLGGREDLYDQEGDVLLTPEGIEFAEAGVQEEKTLFRRQALPHILLLGQILRELRSAPDHRLQEDHLLEQLETCFSPAEARRQLDTAVDWGRCAELFGYDDEAGEFFLEDDPQ